MSAPEEAEAEGEEWVHVADAGKFGPGDVIGWPDAGSDTGLLSGVVVEVDMGMLRVLVKDIKPAIVRRVERGCTRRDLQNRKAE